MFERGLYVQSVDHLVWLTRVFAMSFILIVICISICVSEPFDARVRVLSADVWKGVTNVEENVVRANF